MCTPAQVRSSARESRGPDHPIQPPSSNRTTHEIHVNPEIFCVSGGVGGAVNRQLLIDISCMPSCTETWASIRCRSHAWPRRPTKLS